MPQAQIKQRSLDSLTPHQRAVYDIVREHGPLGPGTIHAQYTETLRTHEQNEQFGRIYQRWNNTICWKQ